MSENEIFASAKNIMQDVQCSCGKVFTVPITQTETIYCGCGKSTTFEGSYLDLTKSTVKDMQKLFDK